MTPENEKHRAIKERIRELAPWHHDIQLTEDLSTGEVFSPTRTLPPAENSGVSLISPTKRFFQRVKSLYPDGLANRRFLDCACNGGAYCFLARELDVEFAMGFDVREHWINQANFVQQERTIAPVDRIVFKTTDLYDVPQLDLEPFDLTYFSGLLYHLPDPVTGLKIAADLTSDIIVVNTACVADAENPLGLTMVIESTEMVMSGVYELAWFPNGPETVVRLLRWMGFVDFKLTLDIAAAAGRRRIEVVAARQKDRLNDLAGTTIA